MLSSHQDITNQLRRHFQSIATEPECNRREAIARVTSTIPKLITDEKNSALERPVSLQEVEVAVREMANGKALGPNGFTVDFFKACWDIVKEEIWEVVEDSRLS